MRKYFSPTETAAIGAVDKEIAQKHKEAENVARLYRRGLINDTQLIQSQRDFRGVYKNFLNQALEKMQETEGTGGQGKN